MPPVSDPVGRVHEIVFELADVGVAVTLVRFFGVVVTVTEAEGDDGADVPEVFVAVTVKVGVAPAGIPVTVIGDDDPDAVCPVLAVTVYEVAGGEPSGNVKVTDTAPPLVNDRPLHVLVGTTLIGGFGSRKSFADVDLLPVFLVAIIYPLFLIRLLKISVNNPSICCSLEKSRS